jgi:hypothetical protein
VSTFDLVVLPLLVGLLIGCAGGIRLMLWALYAGIKEGRWTRAEMQHLLDTWRGPKGETW